MTEKFKEDEIDLRALVNLFWASKSIIVSASLAAALLSVSYALWLPNVYQSSALLSPSEGAATGMGGLLSQYSGLANLAGVNLPITNDASDSGLAIEVMKSRAFTEKFIRKHKILPELFAVKGWDPNDNELIFDPDIFDSDGNKWTRRASGARSAEPSPQEAFAEFKKILAVSQDPKTQLVTVSVRHKSPEVARQWVEWLVEEINETMRQKDIEEAEESIDYLKRQIDKTTIADLDRVFFELMQGQTQRMMLANVRREYVFFTVDPAVSPEIRAEPDRAFIAVFGTLLGALGGMAVAFGWYIFKRIRAEGLD